MSEHPLRVLRQVLPRTPRARVSSPHLARHVPPPRRRRAYISQGGDVLALRLQRMKATPVVAIDLHELLQPYQKESVSEIRDIWNTHFTAIVSPWLSKGLSEDIIGQNFFIARRDLDAVLAGTQQQLLGLAHMGERGLVHRDVKPTNIMLNDGVLTHIDLGMACVYRTFWKSKKDLNCVLPKGDESLAAKYDCLWDLTTKSSTATGVACNKNDSSTGSESFASPAILPAVFHKQNANAITSKDTILQKPQPELCVFNRRACAESTDPEDLFAGVDSFSVGVTLLTLLAGADHTFLGKPRFPTYHLIMAAQVARYLALDDVSASSATPGKKAELRVKVRARARALLEAAVATAGDIRATWKGDGNIFVSAPASAVGILEGKGNACLFNDALKKKKRVFLEIIADLTKTDSTSTMQICTWRSAGNGAGECTCDSAQNYRDAAAVSAAKTSPQQGGTNALLDLLANLLSPSKTPGLAKSQTTLLALANSVDNVRALLYKQWGLKAEAKQLKSHFAAVKKCAAKKKCGKKSRLISTVAGASASCRKQNLQRLSPKAKATESRLSAGIDGNHKANAVSRISSRKSSIDGGKSKLLIASDEQQLVEANKIKIGLLIKSGSRSSSTSVTSVKNNDILAQYKPAFYMKWMVAIAPTPELLANAASAGKTICNEYNLKVAPGSMILAAVTSVAKSNHKARDWGTRDTVRHLVLTREYASGNVTLSIYKNVAPPTGKKNKPTTPELSFTLLSNGELFGESNSKKGAKSALKGQGLPCETIDGSVTGFLPENGIAVDRSSTVINANQYISDRVR